MSGAAKAPEGYQPDIAHELVYDDQVDDLAPSHQWHTLFAGGSNRRHFIRVDEAGGHHYIEQVGFDSYDVSGPGYSLSCDTAPDAFWSADAVIDGK